MNSEKPIADIFLVVVAYLRVISCLRVGRWNSQGLWYSLKPKCYISYHKLCHKGICSNASHLSAGFVNSAVVLVKFLAVTVNVPATMFALPYFSVDKPCRLLTVVFQERVFTTGNFFT